MKYYKLSMDMERENDIVCHYQNDSCVPYEWGIALNGKNKEKYIDLKEA